MRIPISLIAITSLASCDAGQSNTNGIVTADEFAKLSCTATSDPEAITTNIIQATAGHAVTVEQTQTIAGRAGTVISIVSLDHPREGLSITVFFEDGADEVIVYAYQAADPNAVSYQILNLVSKAEGLDDCTTTDPGVD